MLPEVIAAGGCCLCERIRLVFFQALGSAALSPSPHLLVQPHSPLLAGSVERIVLKYGAKTDDTVSLAEIKGG